MQETGRSKTDSPEINRPETSPGTEGRDIRVQDIRFPEDLPVAERREDIARAIAGHQVVIVAGETGSGKTTQLPKICLALGRGRHKMIGHTQPRRLAARTVAQRIAQELDTGLGDLVGYQVRFTDQVSAASAIKLMTDGILLAEIQRDRLLRAYDTIIIDEAHERSLNIDFLLGYLKRLLPQRPDLKLIITSATIDVDSFSRHFDDAPVIEVSGRAFPVETHYIDVAEQDSEDDSSSQIAALVGDIDAGRFGSRGDVLVFLPGERDIRELARRLRHNPALDVLPLYARLSQAEQARVFDTASRRGYQGGTGHQCGGDLDHRPGYSLRDRPGRGADQPLQLSHQGPAPADRAGVPGQREPAPGALRPGCGRRVPATVQRSRFPAAT